MKKSGFSIIELLVVATIIVVLSTIGLVSYRQATVSSRNAKRKADLETVRAALVMYRTDEGNYPDTDSFSSMLGELQAGDYLNVDNIEDPKNDSTYRYRYDSHSNGASFDLCAYLEADPIEHYCVYNP